MPSIIDACKFRKVAKRTTISIYQQLSQKTDIH